MMSEKKDISSTYNSIFDQNTVTEIEDVIEGKDYQQAIFGQDMSGAMNEVLYTRSQYIKDYSDVVNNYKKERNEQIKSIVMVSAVALVLSAVAEMRYWFMGTSVVTGLIKFIGGIISVVVTIVPPFLIFGYIRQIFRSKKLMKKAIEKIDNIKNEHMTNATYDANR